MDIDAIVKLGGSALRAPAGLDRAVEAIRRASRASRLLVVPGGGPFADAVREAERAVGLSADTAHWMAIRAMDQSAAVIAERLAGAAIVDSAESIASAIARHRVPVLAPYSVLESADPLPHSWDVTSDSIAAWAAGFLGARRLILIKPSGVGCEGVDPYFERALPEGLDWRVVPLDRVEMLPDALTTGPGALQPAPGRSRAPSAPERSRW